MIFPVGREEVRVLDLSRVTALSVACPGDVREISTKLYSQKIWVEIPPPPLITVEMLLYLSVPSFPRL